MPTICSIRGIQIFINWRELLPPHFHAKFAGHEVSYRNRNIGTYEYWFPFKTIKNRSWLGSLPFR